MPQNPEPQPAQADAYDALDEALMETFPASDPVAVSAPLARPITADRIVHYDERFARMLGETGGRADDRGKDHSAA